MAFESGGGQRFPYSSDQVFSGLLHVLPQNGFKIKSHDEEIGRIECSSGMSLFSWGENISLSIEGIDSSSTRLNIHSGLKVQGARQALITGEGRNAKNISLIIAALTAYLKSQKKPERPTPVVHPAIPPPPNETLSFFLYLNEQVKGPFSIAQINGFLQLDSVTPMTPCCPEGSQRWLTISDCFR
jgi:hypothetical protein